MRDGFGKALNSFVKCFFLVQKKMGRVGLVIT